MGILDFGKDGIKTSVKTRKEILEDLVVSGVSYVKITNHKRSDIISVVRVQKTPSDHESMNVTSKKMEECWDKPKDSK